MATPRTRSRTKAAAAAPVADNLALARTRHQIEYVPIGDIIPYPYNPRDNEKAIPAVAESIRNFGFLVPCVIDADNVLVAGHTRTEGAKLLGLDEVPCIRASNLTQDQINAFRLIDNKVSEQALWDHDLLAGEIQKLGELGLDWTSFGWDQSEIDCLSETVAADCLTATSLTETAERATASHQERRAPTQTRIVIGDLIGFVPAADYRAWIAGLRSLHNFDEAAMNADVRERLGILTAEG